MPHEIGILSTAHMHAFGYGHGLSGNPAANLVGVWDDDAGRGKAFAEKFGVDFHPNREDLLAACDAVIITSENRKHLENAEAAAAAGKPMDATERLDLELARAELND